MSRQVLTLPDVPATLLTEAEATTRYLPLTGGTVSGDILHPKTGGYLGWIVRSDQFYAYNSAGPVYYPLAISAAGDSIQFNNGTMIGTLDAAQNWRNVLDDKSGNASIAGALTVAGSPAVTQTTGDLRYSPLSHNHDAAYSPTAHNHDAAYLKLTGGTLSGNLGVGVAPAAWPNGWRTVQAGTTALAGVDGIPHWAHLYANSYYDGAAWRAIGPGTHPSSHLRLTDGGLVVATAPSVAAGAAQTFTTRLQVAQNGTVTLTPDAPQAALQASGFLVSGTYSHTMYGPWRSELRGFMAAQAAFWGQENSGLAVMSSNSMIRQATSTQYTALLAGAASELRLHPIGGEALALNIAPSVAAGAQQTWTRRLAVDNNGSLTVNPVAGQWGINLTAGTGIVQTVGDLQLFSTSNFVTLGALGAHRWQVQHGGFYPTSDNAYILCGPVNRATAVYAVNGAIQTSVFAMKEAFAPLDPAACATAVLETDWVTFRYLPPEGGSKEMLEATAPARHQKGYVLQSPVHKVADLFGLDDRESVNSQSDLAVVACALQGALKRIATLETHILALEAR